MPGTIGPVLVTGGCGLLGYHIVEALLQDPTIRPIHVTSRNPTTNVFDGVTYYAGDLGDASFVSRLLTDLKPAVVFHVASPRAMDNKQATAAFEQINVSGTSHLLESAKRAGVKAFIYSSTVNVISGYKHVHAAEDSFPYWESSATAMPYWKSKARGEQLVLAANSDSFQTVALRPCMIIGPQEHSLIPMQLDALAQGKSKFQLGDNTNRFDIVSADNCADAHLLAMHALLNPTLARGGVAGEAFNITDGCPMPFWDAQRIIWRTAGDQTELKDVTVIPAWVASTLASVGEVAYGLFTWGTVTPELNSHVVAFCTSDFTYDIGKARRVLGYAPDPHTEEFLAKSTRWEMDRRARLAASEKGAE